MDGLLCVGALALLELTFRELHVLSHRKLPRPAVFAVCPGPRCVVRRPHPHAAPYAAARRHQ